MVVGGCLILLSMGIGLVSVARDPLDLRPRLFKIDIPQSLLIELIFDNA